MFERPFFSLLSALEARGYDCIHKEMERGSDCFIGSIMCDGIVAFFGEESWNVSDYHQPSPYICGGFSAEAGNLFDKISKCPLQVFLPETQEQLDELLDKLDFLSSKKGHEWSFNCNEFEYEHLIKWEFEHR